MIGDSPAAAAMATAAVVVVDNEWQQKRPATRVLMVA